MFEGYIVKVVKAEIPSLWYASEIGKEFVVLSDSQDGYSTYLVVNVYSDVTLLPPKRWIRIADTEIVRKEKFSIHYTSKIIPR